MRYVLGVLCSIDIMARQVGRVEKYPAYATVPAHTGAKHPGPLPASYAGPPESLRKHSHHISDASPGIAKVGKLAVDALPGIAKVGKLAVDALHPPKVGKLAIDARPGIAFCLCQCTINKTPRPIAAAKSTSYPRANAPDLPAGDFGIKEIRVRLQLAYALCPLRD